MAQARTKARPGGARKAQVRSATRSLPPPEPKSQRRAARLARHAAVAALAGALTWAFWSSRPQWDPEMRLWKAVGDAGFVLLALTLALGPAARLARRLTPALAWRRQLGIWFALVAAVHAVLVLNGWARWSLQRFLGYEFVPQLGRDVRLEPGFGLANLVGLTALGFALVLAATSSDRALRLLGPSWRWLHHSALFVFHLSLLHAGYFLFLHYTESFHKTVPEPDWFRVPFVLIGAAVLALQAAAFVQTTRKRARRADA